MRWRADEIGDLSGKTAVVTGATGGLGFPLVLELARQGASVVLTCRDHERGQAAAKRIREIVPDADGSPIAVDLTSLQTIHRFVDDVTAVSPRVDILVNNAGVMAVPRGRTVEGFETHLGTNHLGHFALTGLLLPALINGGTGRVVTVSSAAHRTARIRFDDLQFERRYNKWAAYGQSKLANLLFTVGCCDNSPNRHATAHFTTERHPIIQSYEPGEDWWFCYLDDIAFLVDDAPSFEHP